MASIRLLLWLLSIITVVTARHRPSSSAEDGMMHGFRHLPPFVESASKEAKDELKKVWSDKSLTKEQLSSKLEQWAKDQGGDILKKFNEFKQHLTQMKQETADRIQNSSLPENLKNIAQQIDKIQSDMSLTIQASKDKVKELMKSIGKTERRQILDVLKPLRRPPQSKTKRNADEGPAPMEMALLRHFMSHISKEGRVSLKAIIDNKSLTKRQLTAELSDWATKQGQEVKTVYDETLKKVQEMKTNVKKALEDSSLNENIRKVLDQLLSVFENQDITLAQEAAERREILSKQPAGVKKEIFAFLARTIKI